MDKFSKFIQKVIEDYLENELELDEDSFPSSEYIIDSIDTKELSKKIVESMKDRILQYDSTCEGVHLSCNKCFRPFGTWKTKTGPSLGDNLVSSHGKRILIIDDF
jgi:hypothetical protein